MSLDIAYKTHPKFVISILKNRLSLVVNNKTIILPYKDVDLSTQYHIIPYVLNYGISRVRMEELVINGSKLKLIGSLGLYYDTIYNNKGITFNGTSITFIGEAINGVSVYKFDEALKPK